MGKHSKPNKIQKRLAVAVPAIVTVPLLMSGSTPPALSLADAVHTPVDPTSHVVSPVHMPTQWQALATRPHKIVHKAKHKAHQTFNHKVLKAAKSQIGVPYVWGGETPGVAFDCSGLVQFAYEEAGKWVPRVANDQFQYFKMIPKSKARPGDLVFFHDSSDPYSYVYHVGIYVGGNDMMVVAPDAGSNVQIQNFDWGGDTVTFGSLDIRT